MSPQMKADRVNCDEIRTSLVKYSIVDGHFHFPSFSSLQQNVSTRNTFWEHLLQLRGNFFDTPLFSLILNFLQLNNIETHSLLSSSHYDSIFYRGKKKTNGRLKRCKLYSRRYLKLFSFFNIFLQLCVHTNPIHFKIMYYTFFLIQFIIKKYFMNYLWDLKAHKHVQHEHILGYMA